MTISFWQQAAREPALTFDVVVVGGGIIGVSAAYWLKRAQPQLRVAVVEAGRLAQGASGRNAGFLLQGAASDFQTDLARYGAERARRLWYFTRENRDLIFAELQGSAFELEAGGSLTVAATAEEDTRLRASVGPMRADGAPAAYLPAAEVGRRIHARGFLGGVYVPSGAALHPVLLVRHIAQRAQAEVLEHHPVVALAPEAGGVRLETTRRLVRAGQVVLALGAYLPRLVPALGAYVEPVRAQMLATCPARSRWLPLPVYSHEGFFYVRQHPGGVVLVGGARHLHRAAEVGYEDATTAALQRDLEGYLHHHFPLAEGLDVAQRWSGTMGFSPDHLPVLGAVPEVPGSFWATGFTGHGMGYGFRFGRLLAEVALGVAHPEGYDLFSAARFEPPARKAAP